jgi:23S rRNA G2445 N2-methylase RlmL
VTPQHRRPPPKTERPARRGRAAPPGNVAKPKHASARRAKPVGAAQALSPAHRAKCEPPERTAPKRKPARPPQPVYFAHVVPGIEDLAAAELTRLGATVRETLAGFDRRDSIITFGAADPAPALAAGLLEDVFAVMLDAPTPAGRAALKELAASIDRPALERALALHNAVRPKSGRRTYGAVARVAGRRAYLREEVEAAFTKAIGKLLPRWSAATERAALEVWVQLIGERTLVGVRISGDELSQRRYKSAHLPASLKPTVARALVLLSEPRPRDVVLDPMCGAGTILRERADAGRARAILGGDTDPEAAQAARTNAGRSASVARWDATRLPLPDRSVDAVICNPPYGRRLGEVRGLDRLYARSTREMARVLRPDGRCVLLTGEPDVLFRALSPALRVVSKRRILMRGLPVVAFVMVRA